MFSVRGTLDSFCPPALSNLKARIKASPIAYRLARGTFWSLFGTIVSRFLGLASSIFVARIIGKVGMGELGMIQSTVGMFSVLGGLGLGLAATKHVAEYRVKDPSIAGETIGFLSLLSWISGVIMTAVVVAAAPWLARHTLAAPELATQLRMASLLLLFGVVNGVQTGVLSGFEAFKSIARINLLSGLANFPLVIGAASFAGLPGAVGGIVVSLLFNCVLNFFAIRREATASGIFITSRNLRKHWNLLWRFGLPGMLSGLISGPIGWLTSTALVRQPGGYAEMGIYSATNNWFQAVAFLPNLLGQVLLPILASHGTDRNQGRMNRVLFLATCANLAIVVPVIAVGCILSRQIMSLYGAGFADGWLVLVLTMLSAGALMIQGPVANHLIATSRMWAYFWAHVGWGTIFLTGTLLLVPSHGGAGLALARLIAYIANGVWVFGIVWWYARSTRKWKAQE